jgi:hypothetical protein
MKLGENNRNLRSHVAGWIWNRTQIRLVSPWVHTEGMKADEFQYS